MSFSCACNEGKVRSNLFYNVDLNGYSIPPTQPPYLGSIEGVFFPFLEEISFFANAFFGKSKSVFEDDAVPIED